MGNHDKRQDKNTEKSTQLLTIFNYLQNHISTASMVAKATGISINSIRGHKRYLEKKGLLAEVEKGYCESTNHLAWYLTTNKKHFQIQTLLKQIRP